MEKAGMINLYLCDNYHATVTINRDGGTTPFMITCKHDGCTSYARSQMYACLQKPDQAKFEWYTPDESEMKTLSGAAREHVSMGGLLLREIKK